MKKEDSHALQAFEVKVRTLLESYKRLQEENERLRCALDAKKEEAQRALVETDEIKRKMEQLKMAKMLTLSNDDLGKAKAQIERLIRKVDKCIAMLGV